ncbi:MAG: L-threonylcarbamoyladenylate synthase [Bacteroidota bacterium]|nr:L-threonylcarbamoyladenylate synthase [Bacteroidota bacterium]
MVEIGINILHARQLLENQQLVAIPTETVYGLGGNAYDAEAVIKIFKVKNRPNFDPLITHTDSLDKIREYVERIPEEALILAKRCWPGPLTLLLEKKAVIPDIVTAGLSTVAVRIPNHELTLSLLKSLDFPVAAPSANPFGYISPTTAQHVADQLGKKIPYILDGGPCKIGIESTIIGFEKMGPVVLRLGGMELNEIENIIGKVKVNAVSSSNPKAPGMLKSHYSPSKSFKIGNIAELLVEHGPHCAAILSFKDHFDVMDKSRQVALSRTGDIAEAAKNLFAAMRYLDSLPVEYIFGEYVPDKGLGKAINDRLKRAATN